MMFLKSKIAKSIAISWVFTIGAGFSSPALSILVGCEVVVQKAGLGYEFRNQRAASLMAPEVMPSEFGLSLIERNGAWYIYEAGHDWFGRETCGGLSKQAADGKWFEFTPVLLNRHTGKSAIINGTFLIKTHQNSDLEKVAVVFGIKLLTQMPNGSSAIFDVKPQVSYDALLEQLERNVMIQTAVPLLTEQRYQLR